MADALQYANNFATTLDGALNAGVASMVLTSVTGLPTPSVAEPTPCTIWDSSLGEAPDLDANMEIVWITAINVPTRTCTILRGQEGTGDNSHSSGHDVRCLVTAGGFSVLKDYLDAGPTFNDLKLFDTDQSHEVTIAWNENEAAADRALNFTLNGGDRNLALHADLTVESASLIDQDLTADSTVAQFAVLTIPRINAATAAGLSLYDDGGNLGVFVADGGYVGFNEGTPLTRVHVEDGILLFDSANFAIAKFNSQGVAWSTILSELNIVFNADAGDKPEISWLRGSRTYPEFSIRQSTIVDTGGEFWSGAGTSAPEKIVTIAKDSNIVLHFGAEGVGEGATFRWAIPSGVSGSGVVGAQIQSDITQADPATLKADLRFSTNTGDSVQEVMRLTDDARVAIGITSASGKAHVDQSSSSGAIPTLVLDQADVSEGFINFIGSDRGIILESVDSVASIRIEIGGAVYRLAAYADA